MRSVRKLTPPLLGTKEGCTPSSGNTSVIQPIPEFALMMQEFLTSHKTRVARGRMERGRRQPLRRARESHPQRRLQ